MSWLVENSVLAALAALVILVGCRVFRPRPALAHVLWLLVLVKLLCPPIVHWQLPVEARVQTARLVTVPSPARIGPAPVVTPRRTTSTTWLGWMLRVWAIGSAVAFVAVLRGMRRLRRLAGTSTTVPAWLSADLDRLAARMQVRVPRVRIVRGIGSAFVWSAPRPELFLPLQRVDLADREQLCSILAHELAHLRRRDHWVAWFELVAILAFWWHPLLWLTRVRMRQQAELACDAWTVWAIPAARRTYAGALIDALQQEFPAIPAVPVLGARPSARRAFEKRLKMILNEDVPRRLSRWALVPVAAFSVVLLSGFSFAQERTRDASRTTNPIQRVVRQQVLKIVNDELRANFGKRYEVRDVAGVRDAVRAYVAAELRALTTGKRRARTSGAACDRKTRGRQARGRELARRMRQVSARAERATRLARRRKQKAVSHPLVGVVQGALRMGLAQARREIRADADLRKLGLTDDLVNLVDGFVAGKGLDLEGFVGKAMDAGLRVARHEIRSDETLRQLGIARDLEGLVASVLDSKSDVGRGLQRLLGKVTREGLGATDDDADRDDDDAVLRKLRTKRRKLK